MTTFTSAIGSRALSRQRREEPATAQGKATAAASTTLFSYRVRERIGQGAGSSVYRVAHPDTGREYALKHVVCLTEKDQRFVQQLRQEHEAAQAVAHHRVRRSVAYHERRGLLGLGRAQEAALVLELVDGVPVQPSPHDVPRAARTINKLATAVAGVHAAGFVHCDLKPQNALIDATGQVRLIDLGQACAAGTIKERIQGTPDFISPEQVQCQPVSPRTDVYCLGAVAYHLLTGQKLTTLFTLKSGDNSFLLDAAIPAAADVNPRVPGPLSALVAECVRTRADKRPELADVIRRLEVIRYGMRNRDRRDRPPEPVKPKGMSPHFYLPD